ncbi:hypothetical protein DHEL01_v210830, partial [Diaporthe helianthi]
KFECSAYQTALLNRSVTDLPSTGDFQPDSVRAEMIGILATRVMELTKWSTRICLNPVKFVRDRSSGTTANRFVETIERRTRLRRKANNGLQYKVRQHTTPRVVEAQSRTPRASGNNSEAGTKMSVSPVLQRASTGSRQPTLSPVMGSNGQPVPGPGILAPGSGYRWGFSKFPKADNHWFLLAYPEDEDDELDATTSVSTSPRDRHDPDAMKMTP